MMCTQPHTHTTIIRVYAPRERQIADIGAFANTELLSELEPVIVSYLRRHEPHLKVERVIVSERTPQTVEFEVLTVNTATKEKAEETWYFKYRFEGIENWKVHKLQSSARLIYAQKL